MKDAAAMFIGSAENVYALSMCRDEEAARLITDILGGSVNNKMTALVIKLAQLVAESREGLMGCRKLCEQPIKARGDNL
ncbi:hypothetical protein [Vagococcus acidifermentans]|uniref:hypothetical protein n=1 Tax=Vagococcus acidifermentans TaxID=564710 RepID=UPI001FE6C4BF|nr:hypothetical protein [Vagococcus acidifermentans]